MHNNIYYVNRAVSDMWPIIYCVHSISQFQLFHVQSLKKLNLVFVISPKIPVGEFIGKESQNLNRRWVCSKICNFSKSSRLIWFQLWRLLMTLANVWVYVCINDYGLEITAKIQNELWPASLKARPNLTKILLSMARLSHEQSRLRPY